MRLLFATFAVTVIAITERLLVVIRDRIFSFIYLVTKSCLDLATGHASSMPNDNRLKLRRLQGLNALEFLGNSRGFVKPQESELVTRHKRAQLRDLRDLQVRACEIRLRNNEG